MVRTASMFSQLLNIFPRIEFEKAVRAHKAERYAKGFTCWEQFVAMLFCQLAQAHSLREICGGLSLLFGQADSSGSPGCTQEVYAIVCEQASSVGTLRERLLPASGEMPAADSWKDQVPVS